jgi:DNA-directed RNA polymerase subunit M/transcription elongation factor TFIIS
MNKFCEYCGNLKTIEVNQNKLQFRCNVCNKVSDTTIEDNLLYEKKPINDENLHKIYITNAKYDNLNSFYHEDCINPNCKNKYVRLTRLANDTIIILTCQVCGAQWRRS